MANGKHAYLIMAHGHFELLRKLISMLDHERHDIYVHVDARVKDFDPVPFFACISRSRLIFTRRIPVYWGHSSQIDCEMLLLEACLENGDYDFVHLLSGVDLPIKSRQYILDFFDAHPDTQFLQVGDASRHLTRLSRYHPAIKYRGRENGLVKKLDAVSDILQNKLGTDRLKKYGGMKIVKTANRFSLTGECAKYVLSKKRFIRRLTRYTVCADEMFLGTVIAASPYWEQVYNKEPSWDGHMRYIDRERNVGSSPHTFTIEDKDLLDASEMLFARKFDVEKHPEIVDYVFDKYGRE